MTACAGADGQCSSGRRWRAATWRTAACDRSAAVLKGAQDLLRRILGRFCLAEHSITQVIDVGLVGLDKRREGLLAATLCLHDQ
jgi:hypothetical protein